SLAQLNDGARRQVLAGQLAEDLLGSSPAMQALRDQVVRAAETRLAVLLQGETGTGKDRVAQAIHRLSSRREGHSWQSTVRRFPNRCLSRSCSAMLKAPSLVLIVPARG